MRASALVGLPAPFARPLPAADGSFTAPKRRRRPKPVLVLVEDPVADDIKLRPLVKWIGSKRRLAAQIVSRLPRFSGAYWEPMCGGASIFCALRASGALNGRRVVLADVNESLMALYRAVKDEPDDLLAKLQTYKSEYEAASHEKRSQIFYRERSSWNDGLGNRLPHRFVFLKQTAFNGLWRVNKKGEMNAPWGKYDSPVFFDEDNVRAWHEALQNVELRSGSIFNGTCAPESGDLVYLDPPYVDTFTSYSSAGFDDAAQVSLLAAIHDWTEAEGAQVAYSNSHAANRLLNEHWPDGVRHVLKTSYTVNRDGAGRKTVQELLVTSV